MILTTKDKYKDVDKIKDGLIKFGKMLKFMQHTMNLLKEEFLHALERNSDFKKMKFDTDDLPSMYSRLESLRTNKEILH